MREAGIGRVESIETTSVGRDPKHAVFTLDDGADAIVGEVGVRCRVTDERALFSLKLVQAAAMGADPEITATVLEDARDSIPGERVLVIGIVTIVLEAIGPGVISLQAVLERTDPKRAFAVPRAMT